MTRWFDERSAALWQLMQLPDPPDLPVRGKRLVNPGDPATLRRVTWAYLPLAYVAHERAQGETR